MSERRIGTRPPLALLALAAMVFLCAASRAARSPTRQAPLQIGVLVWSPTIPGQIAMRRGLEEEAAALSRRDQRGIDLFIRVAGDGPDGQERQIAQMRAFVAQGVDAIIVQPTDGAALVAPLQEANAAGIPVIAYDQYIAEGRLAAFLTSDNRQAGVLDAEVIAHAFPDTHTIRLVLVEYPNVTSTVERLDGFLDTLTALKQPFHVLATYKAVEPAAGRRVGARILRDFPKPGSIDVVFTVNDGGGVAVVDTLLAAGRTEIRVASIDGDPTAVARIKSGTMNLVDAAQFCGGLGRATMRTTYKLLRGENVPPVQYLPTFPITAETAPLYHGWAGALPAAFDKPWPSRRPRWSPALKAPRRDAAP